MKILLFNPPSPEGTQYVRVERCMQKKSAWAGSLWQPMPLLYMSSYLKSKNYETLLVDAVAEGLTEDGAKELIRKQKPDILVLNTAVPTIEQDLIYADYAKKLGIIIVGFGVPISTMQDIIGKRIDFGIKGDPEYAILEIVKSVENNKKIDERYIVSEKPFLLVFYPVEDLNNLPMPDLSDLKLDAYTLPFTRKKLMLVEPGRGCPWGCIYCLVPHLSGRKIRLRSPIKFVDELERDVKEYKIKDFLFWVETATFNKKNMVEICDEILKRGLKISWMTPSRVDCVDFELLKKMRKAGCWMISYGIESIEQDVLDNIQKGTTVEQMESAIKNTRAAGIKTMAHIIFGLPGQKKGVMEKTLDWLYKNNADYAQFYCAVPYWGTKLREIAEEKGWIETDDPTKYEIDNSVMHTDDLTSAEIMEMRETAFRKFYLRPKKIMQEIWWNKNNPRYILNLAKDGFYFLFNWVKK